METIIKVPRLTIKVQVVVSCPVLKLLLSGCYLHCEPFIKFTHLL